MTEAPKLPEDAEEREAILKAFKMEHGLPHIRLAVIYGVSKSTIGAWLSKRERERNREKNRQWRKANSDKVKAKRRRYRKAHIEDLREKDRERYKSNPEKTRKENRRWREANPEKIRETRRQWYKDNPQQDRQRTAFNKFLKDGGKCFIVSWVRCGADKLLRYLEYQFEDCMSWENYGRVWFVGFHEPFDYEDVEAARVGWHYRNLKPTLYRSEE